MKAQQFSVGIGPSAHSQAASTQAWSIMLVPRSHPSRTAPTRHSSQWRSTSYKTTAM